MTPRQLMDDYAKRKGYSDWSDLHGQSTDHIEEYTEELIQEILHSSEYQWLSAEIECPICTHTWWAVFPSSAKELECPNCRRMSPHNIT